MCGRIHQARSESTGDASSLPPAPLGSEPRSRRCPPRAPLPRLALQGRPKETQPSGLRQASPRARSRLRAGFLEPGQSPDVPRSRPPRIWALVRLHTHKLTSRLVRTHRTAPVSSGRSLPTQLPALLFHRMLPGAAGLQSIRRSPEHWPSRVPGVGWGFIYSWVKRQGWRAENPVDCSPFPERGALEGVAGRP